MSSGRPYTSRLLRALVEGFAAASLRARSAFVRWLFSGVKVDSLRVGRNSIRLGDTILIDATAAPTQTGEIGRDSSGNLTLYVSGSERRLLHLGDTSASASPNKIPIAGSNGVIAEAFLPAITSGTVAVIPFVGGNGQHGSVTLASGGGSVVSGVIGWDAAASEYYLISDLQANNLTLESGVACRADGWRFFVLRKLWMKTNSLLHANGTHASGATAGVGALPRSSSAAPLAGGCNGVNGLTYTTTTTGNGSSSTAISGTVRRGGVGGSGGGKARNSSGLESTGGSAATGTAWADATHGLPNAVLGPQAITASSSATRMAGGTAGGAGGCRNSAGTTSISGGSGGSAGVLAVSAFQIEVEAGAKLQANGGDGGDASCPAGTQNGCGGGGNGSGAGAIVLVVAEVIGEALVLEAIGGDGGDGAALTPSAGGNLYGDGGNGGNGGYINAYVGSGGVSTDVSGGAAGVGAVAGPGAGVAANGTAGAAGTAITAPQA